jgi:L-amino acid N-acyltransferase YncA
MTAMTEPARGSRIRLPFDDDLPRVVEIYNGSIPGRMATADTQPVTIEERREWFGAHSQATNPLWVMEVGGQVAAWLSLSPFYGRPAYNATKEVSVYVDASMQRQGLASSLIRHSLETAPAMGVTTLLGFIFSHNAPSIRLFRGFGFTSWGELRNVAILDGMERSLSIFGKRL